MDTGNNGILGQINLDAVEEFKLLTNAYQARVRPLVGRAGEHRHQRAAAAGSTDRRILQASRSASMQIVLTTASRHRAGERRIRAPGLKAINRQSDFGLHLRRSRADRRLQQQP